MRVNEELLERCEEFFEQIINEEDCVDLDYAIDSLRHFLEKDIDGFTQFDDEELIYAVQNRMEEIWDLISTQEKK